MHEISKTETEARAFSMKLVPVSKELAAWAHSLAVDQGCSAAEIKAMLREAMNVVEGKQPR